MSDTHDITKKSDTVKTIRSVIISGFGILIIIISIIFGYYYGR